jgi:hypothetical protein
MFARAVLIKVKPGSGADLSGILEAEVIRQFQVHPEFLGLLVFVAPDGTKALSLSFWDREDSMAADCPSDLIALSTLAGVVWGTPSARVYTVSNSTLRGMVIMLSQGERIKANPDLKVYQTCAKAFPINARTVHEGLGIPARVALQ